jgi:glucosylceramidase
MVLDTEGKNLDSQDPWKQNALLVVDRAAKKLIITPTYYVFRHLSFFVDPEADVLGTSGGSALAFKNPDGSTVAVVYAASGATMSVSMAGQTLYADMPGQGFATFYVEP